MSRDLEDQILEAHAQHDQMSLVTLYQKAGRIAEQDGDIDAACFFWTHAYVFALEQAHPARDDLHARLVTYGRET
ncbi:hypothetical protein [Cochlodiniinecator piscidefendens]|uniref:hypothetical protein n=1 Tax=Cochlodiniinecator piscidefendens TaxID=2715756 RepID=UPI00140DE316|nr:hypothetical protein [Cochlodiniinecator piscidefendens]